ncbi:hypothetical protein [Aestuariispira ectoiniformans]|uniref:hypothetical protein n=1 Tax=Aestuariispira ectoiniformans TaxID=2775080 RepID=UPI00223B56C2|nr:hypothetical protein [Aestuariispira ectoiniformans]
MSISYWKKTCVTLVVLIFPVMLTSCNDLEGEAGMRSVLIELSGAPQGAAIADQQQAILDKAGKAGMRLENVKTYRMLPQMAADIDGEAALFLLGLDEVAALRPDGTKTIQD